LGLKLVPKGGVVMKMSGLLQRVVLGGGAVLCIAQGIAAGGQTKARAGAKKAGVNAASAAAAAVSPVTALMVSDIHFDPFHDPAKAQRLVQAQEGEWNAILGEPDSAGQGEAFAKLQKTCGARGVDTPYGLLRSSLAAMNREAPEAQFALLSGDLVVHGFDCRFKALLPGKTDADYAAFTEKTVRYVMGQMRLGLGGKQGTAMPVYAALGNNDSGCGDYRMDSGDGFLAATEGAMVDGLPSPAEKKAALGSYAKEGDYSVTMQGAMQGTRLIVLDDLLQSRRYTGCAGKPNPAAVDAQIAWLTQELAGARRRGERVWVMGHIPAGLDAYSTFSKFKDVCKGDEPVMFLSSERMADVMGQYSDVVKLGIFGHTHMDEIRLFGKDGGGAKGKVAIRMISSISPVDGNNPSFTVAKVDPATSRLLDYTVIAASGRGPDAAWAKEYGFGETFHQGAFTAETIGKVMEQFAADPDARNDMSRAYLQHYFVGDQSLLLKSLWPQYVCTMGNHTVKGFAACTCPAGTPAPAAK
jgi:sphingomyelin phosphodiesterase acid-like 3